MKLSNALRSFVANAKRGDSYWVEKAKLDFACQLEKRRLAAGMTYAAVAERIGSSAAYITKVFRGDSNLTIESMVKLARATGCNVSIRVESVETNISDWLPAIRAAHAANQHWASTRSSNVVALHSELEQRMAA